RVVETLAGAEVEALLEDRRRHLRDLALRTHDPARHHVGVAERVEVRDRIERVGDRHAEHRDLLLADERAHAPSGDELVERADVGPHRFGRERVEPRRGHQPTSTGPTPTGICFSCDRAGRTWPRSGTMTMLGSGRSSLTKVRNRRNRAESSSVAFHSHSYVATWRAISASSSSAMPRQSSITTRRRYSMPPSSFS